MTPTGEPGARTTATRPLISVVAPAYNEAGILEANLTRICDYLDGLAERYRWELIVVDDGSRDRTGELARAFAAHRKGVRVCAHRFNLGLGRALRTGFAACRGDYVVVLDVDLTYAPEHVEQLVERLRTTGAEIALASPYMRGGRTSAVPFVRKLLSRWGNRFLALTARGVNPAGDISTLTGMVRAYDAGFLRSLHLKSAGMEINTEVLYKALLLGARVEEVPAHLDWSAHEQTKSVRRSSKRIRRGIVFSLLAGFTIRPFAFFIVPAALLGLVALYVLLWIGYHVWSFWGEAAAQGGGLDAVLSRSLAHAFELSPHAFFVGGITLVLTVQLFSLGVLALQAKQYFEELFHFGTRVYSTQRELERRLADLRDVAGRDPDAGAR